MYKKENRKSRNTGRFSIHAPLHLKIFSNSVEFCTKTEWLVVFYCQREKFWVNELSTNAVTCGFSIELMKWKILESLAQCTYTLRSRSFASFLHDLEWYEQHCSVHLNRRLLNLWKTSSNAHWIRLADEFQCGIEEDPHEFYTRNVVLWCGFWFDFINRMLAERLLA